MTSPTVVRPRSAALSTTVLALIVTFLLTRLDLAVPPVTGFAAFRTFVELHGAVPSALGLFRALAIIGASYVLAIGSLALIASLGTPSVTLRRAIRAVTLPPLRHLVPGLLGTGLALLPAIQMPLVASAVTTGAPSTTTRTSGASQAAAPARRYLEADALVRLPPTSPSQSPSTTEAAEATANDGTASLILIGPDDTTQTTPATSSAVSDTHSADTATLPAQTAAPRADDPTGRFPLADPAVAVTPPTSSPTRSTGSHTTDPGLTTAQSEQDHRASPQLSVTARSGNDATWTVTPGDHLWHIAMLTVTETLHHAATDAQITPYWRRLIAANEARLIDPANPDLILPGQVLVLPGVGNALG